MTVPLTVADPNPDSATRTFSAEISNPLNDIRAQYGLNTPATAITPSRENARFLASSNGSNVGGSGYFLIKPVAGKYPLIASDGTSSGGIVIADDVGIAVYNTPSLLTSATTPAALGTIAKSIAANTLTIAWPTAYTGKFRVTVFANDGSAEVQQSFYVTIG